MRVNTFSLRIPEGRERDSGHVEMAHNNIFTIRMDNHDRNRPCDATVSVDGKEIGAYRINAGSYAVLERSSHDERGRFTFFEANSFSRRRRRRSTPKGRERRPPRPLIEVVFRPERIRQAPVHRDNVKLLGFGGARGRGLPCGQSAGGGNLDFDAEAQNYSAGITGLTGKSEQKFYEVPNLDYEPGGEVTITLRLVRSNVVRELTAGAASQSRAIARVSLNRRSSPSSVAADQAATEDMTWRSSWYSFSLLPPGTGLAGSPRPPSPPRSDALIAVYKAKITGSTTLDEVWAVLGKAIAGFVHVVQDMAGQQLSQSDVEQVVLDAVNDLLTDILPTLEGNLPPLLRLLGGRILQPVLMQLATGLVDAVVAIFYHRL